MFVDRDVAVGELCVCVCVCAYRWVHTASELNYKETWNKTFAKNKPALHFFEKPSPPLLAYTTAGTRLFGVPCITPYAVDVERCQLQRNKSCSLPLIKVPRCELISQGRVYASPTSCNVTFSSIIVFRRTPVAQTSRDAVIASLAKRMKTYY